MVYRPDSSAYADFIKSRPFVAVIGVGYVGLPLSQALSRYFPVIAYDRNKQIVENVQMTSPSFQVTHTIDTLSKASIYIITVPTPVLEETKKPDFQALTMACTSVAKLLKPGDILSFESTVYPTTLDEICTPLLETHSSLKRYRDFFLAYAPERISIGSSAYTLEKLPRIIAADNQKTLETMAFVYGSINNHQITLAPSIKVAEAAKLLENVQRDVNIALMNEISIFCDRLDISARDVIEAAASKPNFYRCYPGLVGGHCIGIDPYYLIEKATHLGTPQSLASTARMVNENMSLHFAQMVHDRIPKASKVLAYGVAFKPNVDDVRNSKSPNFIQRLKELGHLITIVDEEVNSDTVFDLYRLELTPITELAPHDYDALVVLVGHESLQNLMLENHLKRNGIVIDLVGGLLNTPHNFRYWKP